MSSRVRRAGVAVAAWVVAVGVASAQEPTVQRSDSEDSEHLDDLLAEQPERDFGRTSEVEWTLSWHDRWNAGLVERHVTRTTGDTLLQSNLGDENGYHRVEFRQGTTPPSSDVTPEEDELLRIDPARLAGTRSTLIYGGKVWHPYGSKKPTLGGSVVSIGKARSNLPVDFSRIGFAAGPHVDDNIAGLNPWDIEGLESAALERYRSGGLDVVIAEYNDRRVEWYLDPRQDGLPVEAMLFHNDKLVSRSETDYEEVDGRLFPSSVRFYDRPDATLRQVLDVQKTTFDKPWHVQEITPTDIGMVFGTQLWLLEGLGDVGSWDGTEFITGDEYSDLVELYGARPQPKIIEMIAGSTMTPAEYLAWMDRATVSRRAAYFAKHGERPWLDDFVLLKPGEKDEWDVYVEKFIAEHKLKGDVVKRAKDILQRSKKLRDARLRKNAPKVLEAKREGDKKKLAHYEGITKRIFDGVLVRSLNRLLPKSAGKSKTKTAKVAEKE